MKKIIITLFVVLGTAWCLFGQCNLPRVGVGVGISPLDTVALPPFVSPCPTCQSGGKYSWELDSAFRGMIFLNSDLQSDVTVMISQDCYEVLFDTCVSLPPMGIAGLSFYKEYISFGYCQVHVFGLPGQVVSIDVKSAPLLGEPTFDVIMDLDTCGSFLSLQAPETRETEGVLTSLTGVPVGNNPPAGIYLNTYPDEAGKKPRLVRVLR